MFMPKMSGLLVVLLTVQFIINGWLSAAVRVGDFYPFGFENGDSQLEPADDEDNNSVLDVTLNCPFEFYGLPYTYISVSKGVLRYRILHMRLI